jgi:DNA-binding CsgD family transcriptional regulator
MHDSTIGAGVSIHPAPYRGPERRTSASPQHQHCLLLMVDEIDYGMLAVNADADVVHVNQSARRLLDAEHPLQIVGRQLRGRHPHDATRLAEAIAGASQRGLRRLLSLGQGNDYVNIIPLPGVGALVQLGKQKLSERLTVQCYAREKGLTPAESRVLESLCEGLDPRDIAELHEVGLATVRTQIGSIRQKTGTGNIRALVRKVALLPPMRGLVG